MLAKQKKRYPKTSYYFPPLFLSTVVMYIPPFQPFAYLVCSVKAELYEKTSVESVFANETETRKEFRVPFQSE